jgi:NTE family protein
MTPDILVLGGGGLLGVAWMTGVLAGLEATGDVDATRCRAWVGTSAGSIVAARLAAGRRPRPPVAGSPSVSDATAAPPRDAWANLGALSSLPVPSGLGAFAPIGAFIRARWLAALPEGRVSIAGFARRVDRWGAAFDGRLHLCVVDQASGRRVVFGAPRAPSARVGQAVAASCAIPGVYAPVRINGRRYVDGGIWSPTNADAAPVRRGDRVLVLEPTAALLRGALRGAAAIEALALHGRGARVQIVGPDAAAAPLMQRPMGPDRNGTVLEAGYRQGLVLALS